MPPELKQEAMKRRIARKSGVQGPSPKCASVHAGVLEENTVS